LEGNTLKYDIVGAKYVDKDTGETRKRVVYGTYDTQDKDFVGYHTEDIKDFFTGYLDVSPDREIRHYKVEMVLPKELI
jgi:hypothetical protein